MNQVLILFAHPALQNSNVHSKLVHGIDNIKGITFHDLYEAYPDFFIDVSLEQKLLENHNVIILQHPFYWYSTPALLKEWQDLVLEHGWAYGSQGNKLKGKRLISVISTGGPSTAYRKEGYNRYTIKELLAPILQTAYLCGMHYMGCFVVHGTHRLTQQDIQQTTEEYHQFLKALVRNSVNWDEMLKHENILEHLTSIIKPESEEVLSGWR